MRCPYLVRYKEGYYGCSASSELINEDEIKGRICLNNEFINCFEYRYKKLEEKIGKETITE